MSADHWAAVIYSASVFLLIVTFWWLFRVGGPIDKRQMRKAMQQGIEDRREMERIEAERPTATGKGRERKSR